MKILEVKGPLDHQKPWMYKTMPEVEDWCDRAGLRLGRGANITNHDLMIHATTDVRINKWNESNLLVAGKLPVVFHIIAGDLVIAETGITTLEGSMPGMVVNLLLTENPRLRSLKGLANTVVNARVDLTGLGLRTLTDFPHTANKSTVNLSLNSLTSLRGISAETLTIRHNKIQTLDGCPPVESLDIMANPIKSLKGAPSTLKYVAIPKGSPLLDLLGLPSLQYIVLEGVKNEVQDSFDELIRSGKFRKTDRRSVLELQHELHDLDLGEWAWMS